MVDQSIPNYLNRQRAYTDIYEQYVDEASFLWVLRSVAVEQPHYYVSDIVELERRIEAQLDGLMTSLDMSWELCEQALEIEEPGEVFTAAVVAFKSHDAQNIQKSVLAGLANSQTEKGIISALGWIPERISKPWIQKFFTSKDMSHKYLALAACSVRRQDPGDVLNKLLSREDCLGHTKLHARALRLIGELRRQDCMVAINMAMNADDDDIRFWANWSAALLGNRACVPLLQAFLFKPGPYQNLAIQLVFRIVSVEQAREWISALSEDENQVRAVIKAIGVLGDPHAINWLISKMQDPKLAKLAGESFAYITGVDFEKHQLVMDEPDNYPVMPNDDVDDDDIGLDEDENLSYPDVEKVEAIWRNHGQNFIVGRRYFMGRAITAEFLKNKLVHSAQRQRHAAALELALNENDAPLPNTRTRMLIS